MICPPWLQLQLPSQEIGQSQFEHMRYKIKRERERISPANYSCLAKKWVYHILSNLDLKLKEKGK